MKKEEFLAFSLPYGLKGIIKGKENVCGSFIYKLYSCNSETDVVELVGETNFKTDKFIPALHPISDLTKQIEHNGEKFVPLRRLLEHSSFNLGAMTNKDIMEFADIYSNVDLITVNDLPLYLEWKFDIAGLIDKGKAIDVNTLKINPYK